MLRHFTAELEFGHLLLPVTTVQSIAKELRIRPLVLWTSVADSVSPADTKSQRVSFKTTGGG